MVKPTGFFKEDDKTKPITPRKHTHISSKSRGVQSLKPSSRMQKKLMQKQLTYNLAQGKEQNANIIGYRKDSEKLVWMTPQQFRSLTTDPIDYDEPSLTKLKQRMKNGEPIDACWLDVETKTWKVQNHEGRHRAKAAQELGIEKIPVVLYARNGYDWDSADKLPSSPTLLTKQSY